VTASAPLAVWASSQPLPPRDEPVASHLGGEGFWARVAVPAMGLSGERQQQHGGDGPSSGGFAGGPTPSPPLGWWLDARKNVPRWRCWRDGFPRYAIDPPLDACHHSKVFHHMSAGDMYRLHAAELALARGSGNGSYETLTAGQILGAWLNDTAASPAALAGRSLAATREGSAEACAAQCDADAACVTWSWIAGICWRKDAVVERVPVPGAGSGYRLDRFVCSDAAAAAAAAARCCPTNQRSRKS
ncbi:hypothetical protein HK405_013063, partial [Cladochytrium tenue]